MKTQYIIGIIVIGIILVGTYMLDASAAVVSAQGTAIKHVSPDTALVYVSIESRDSTASAAQAEHAAIRDKVLQSLGDLGIDEDSIQLINYAVYQEYDWSNGKQTPKDFVASQQIVVKTTDFDQVSAIVDAVVAQEALVNSIQFELSQEKQNEYKAQVLSEASADARAKAAATADGLGKDLGRLVAVQSQDYYYPGPVLYYSKSYDASSSMGGAATAEVREAAANLTPGDIDVNANIVVQYKLSKF
jgi:uncharacterized protein YggE